jgi:hypothetical protein
MSHGTRTEAEDDVSSAAVPQVVISDLVPEGRALIPVQTPTRTYLAVRPDAEIKQLVQELNEHIEHAYAVGHIRPGEIHASTREHPLL